MDQESQVETREISDADLDEVSGGIVLPGISPLAGVINPDLPMNNDW